MNAKLDTGRVFERIFSFYGSQFTLLIPAALVLFVPVALINGLLLSGDANWFEVLISAVIGTIATYWYQGMVVQATRDILDGRRDQTVGSLFSSAAPFIVPLFAVSVLAGIAIAIGFLLLIVPGLILITIWAVVVPVIVIERAGVFESFGRSRELVRDNGWRVFGVIVVLFLVLLIARAVIQGAAAAISDDSFVGYAIADLIANVLIVPLTALAATVLYVELRRIKGQPLADEGGGAASPLPPQGDVVPQPHSSAGPPEPSDRPPQPAGPQAPAPGPEAPPPGPEPPPR
jgi:hypothetical protein